MVRRDRRRTGPGWDTVDSRAADLLSSEGAPPGLSGQSRRRAPRRVSGATALVSGRVTGAVLRVGFSHLAPIATSPTVGGLREAAFWQPRPRAALPRALHAPRRHFQSPARRRHQRPRVSSFSRQSWPTSSRTPRKSRPRLAPRFQPRSHARSPEVCPRRGHRVDARPDTTRRRRPAHLDRASLTTMRPKCLGPVRFHAYSRQPRPPQTPAAWSKRLYRK